MDSPFTRCAPPVGRYFPGMPPPQLFGVAFEKHGIQHPAEAVDVEVFQRGFRQLMNTGGKVAEARPQGGKEPHVPDSLPFHADGVIKKMPGIVNAGYPPADQHHAVLCLRVGASRLQRLFTPEQPVVKGRSALRGHQCVPPVGDLPALGEKAMAADIHPVPAVPHRAGNAPHVIAFLQQNDLVLFLILRPAEKLVSRCQPRGARADNNNPFSVHLLSRPIHRPNGSVL